MGQRIPLPFVRGFLRTVECNGIDASLSAEAEGVYSGAYLWLHAESYDAFHHDITVSCCIMGITCGVCYTLKIGRFFQRVTPILKSILPSQ